MNRITEKFAQTEKFKDYLNDVKNNVSPINVLGLTDVAKVLTICATKEYIKDTFLVVSYNEIQAKKLVNDLKYFTDNVIYLPKKEIVTYDYIAESKDLPYERIEALNTIFSNKKVIIVTTIEACMQSIIPKDILYSNILKFEIGGMHNLDDIKRSLVYLGYERCDLIEGRGQFSVRGDIVDIAVSDKFGIRIEFWGDEVDSIRRFNISTQRSVEDLKNITIFPAHEYILSKDTNIENICNDILEKNEDAKDKVKQIVYEDIDIIKSGNYISKIDKYFSSFYNTSSTILDYLPKNTIIFLDEINKSKARANNIINDYKIVSKSLIEKEKVVPNIIELLMEYESLSIKLEQKLNIFLESQDIPFSRVNAYSFSFREINYSRASMELLLEQTLQSLKDNKYVYILGGNEENCRKISLLLLEKEIPHKYVGKLDKQIIDEDKVIVTDGALSSGFECYDANLVVITGEELFNLGNKKRRKQVASAFKQGEKVVFADLKIGDYIVHKNHGIGQFLGVNTIKTDGVIKDYIKIKYKGDDILYIPTNALDNIRKYIGAGEAIPKLNKLGGKEWSNAKAKVKSNLREVAKNLIDLYAKRKNAKGHAFLPDTPWQKQFEDEFEYTETDDQLRCIEEVKHDMEKDIPMDRLLCGDVGYGKTEVAIRAAFKACMDQKQVAYLVPTTILANQQYESFKERMSNFPIRVEVLNRFRTKKEQADIIKKLKLGELDIIIGTHRILSKDVEFKDLGLLIIDEEHRFGVKDKEKIKELKTNVDVLTMTATPIPRTLHMSIVGIRDMSVIYEPPQNRKPVQTYVLEYDEEVISEAIIKEIERGGQVFYLYNNVENIVKKAEDIAKLVPDANVGFAHGKMTGNELEEIMMDFINKKINVLVCTTILESGIDIPNANTIIVENADRLGLAQLYQIRGRVGRSDTQAYAYITYKRDKLLSEVADKRLKAIKEFTEFGSGFKIAMRDLEIRGAGSLLGEIQHGHLDQVGYDTYCKLLDEVVKDMQGIEVKEEQDVQIDLYISSYIPDEYIENSSQKIEIYQDIALCRTEEDIQDVIDEITDRYGDIPDEVYNLLEVARIKELCKKCEIIKISQKRDSIIFNFNANNFNMDITYHLLETYKNKIRFSPAREPYITLKLSSNSDNIILKEIKEFLKYICKCL